MFKVPAVGADLLKFKPSFRMREIRNVSVFASGMFFRCQTGWSEFCEGDFYVQLFDSLTKSGKKLYIFSEQQLFGQTCLDDERGIKLAEWLKMIKR